jgi:hypothetical protein
MALDLLTLQSLEGTNAAVINDAENTIIRVSFLETEETRLGNEIIYRSLYIVAANKNGKRYSYVVPVTGPSLRRIEEYGLTEVINRIQQNAFSDFDREYLQIAEDIYYDEEDNGLITFDVEVYDIESKFRDSLNIQPSIEVSTPPPPTPTPKPEVVVEQRKQKVQLKKDRVEQSELTSTDIEGINNAVTEDQKPKGLQKLGSLVLKQSQKLSKFVIPLAFNLIKEYGIDKLETALEEESDNIDELREQLKEEFCNVQLPQIIAKRNNAVDYLNNTGKILDSFTIGVNFGASFAGVLETIIKILRGASFGINQAAKAIPLIPGAVVSAVNDLNTIADTVTFKPDGTPNLPPLKITAAQVSPAFATVQNTIVRCVDLLDKLDILITLCDPNANLTGISDSINTIYDNELIAEASENDGTYKGFILEIETRPFTDTVDQNRAVGKNRSGIIMISTEYSFASNPQVLIDELKFIIDRDDLKAY